MTIPFPLDTLAGSRPSSLVPGGGLLTPPAIPNHRAHRHHTDVAFPFPSFLLPILSILFILSGLLPSPSCPLRPCRFLRSRNHKSAIRNPQSPIPHLGLFYSKPIASISFSFKALSPKSTLQKGPERPTFSPSSIFTFSQSLLSPPLVPSAAYPFPLLSLPSQPSLLAEYSSASCAVLYFPVEQPGSGASVIAPCRELSCI